MTNSHRFRGAAFLLSCVVAGASASAADVAGGGLVGWVENTQGAPVAGAVISLFGRGLRGGALVTLSDSNGQFVLPSVPPGSYTVRALGSGHVPAPPRRVTVLPNRDSLFTVSLTPAGEVPVLVRPAPADDDPIDSFEARWLLRHKRRSVLEAREADVAGEGVQAAIAALALGQAGTWPPTLAGKVELVANAASLGGDGVLVTDTIPTVGILSLEGRLAETGRWRLGGLLSENESTSWRMAAEFVLEPGSGHEVEAGAGYGSRIVRSPLAANEESQLDGTGAIFVQDRWRLGPRLTASAGARYSYIGYVADRNHVDPAASLEYRGRRTAVRGSLTARTLAPGGDLLTLSSLGSAPALGFARLEPDLRAERLLRYEIAIDRSLGAATVGALAFQEDVRDQLVSVFDDPRLPQSLRILNAGNHTARGMGLTVGGRFGDCVNGSLTYTYGHTRRDDPAAAEALLVGPALAYRQADFHDVVARVETIIDGTDTRVVAFYRVNALNPSSEGSSSPSALTNTRFDIQLSQGLPFLQSFTRADWELLLAVRNLFYETSEGGLLDEPAVVNPPKRVLGGISVRF